MRHRGLCVDLAIILALFILSILFFAPVTLGGKTMLPADNVFAWAPWSDYAAQAGVTTPHNGLLSDLYLENYAWKDLIVQALNQGELPLWNPYILSGEPFLAAGQHSALYPFSVLFYVLPVAAAFGWFAALHMFLAGLFTYLLGRTLRLSRGASALAAVTFMACGFMFISQVFPMIVAAAVWLPLILCLIERTIQKAERGDRWLSQVPHLLLGAVAVGLVFLAGHPEMDYYVALTAGAFAAWRLAGLALRRRSRVTVLLALAALAAMALAGVGLGAAQWFPLLKLVQQNFREGGASFQDVLGWAFPLRRVISLLIPDFFGNPAHHSYFDLFSGQWVPATVNALGESIDTIYWGIKNYVEGASYLGVLPTVLAVVGALRARGRHQGFFIALAAFSILCVFGAPIYYLVYKLPGLSQVHSPFRWIYPYSLCMAVLAGMGVDALATPRAVGAVPRWRRALDWLGGVAVPRGALLAGLGTLAALAASLAFKDRVADLAGRAMESLALAPQAFADGRMFYSYEFRNLLIFGAALTLGGLLLTFRRGFRRPAVWAALAVLVAASELYVIGQPFFPAVDADLVAYRTPAIDFLTADPGLFRITAYVGDAPDDKPLNANTAMFYGLQDVRGYDSIITRQYAEYMGLIQEQGELQYNRIAPIGNWAPQALDSALLDLLNVKYVVTGADHTIDRPNYTLVYDGELRIYRNDDYMARAFLVSTARVIASQDERDAALQTFDPRSEVILEEPVGDWPTMDEGETATTALPADTAPQVEVLSYGLNEVEVSVRSAEPAFLVLADSYFDGWLAYLRPADAPDPSSAEEAVHIYRADGNFRAVQVPAGEWVVRFKYSPNEIKFGLYVSAMSAIVLALALGLWLWLRFYRGNEGEQGDVQRVTKNTVTPIGLTLVNRLIDMVFAMLMLRVLGPSDAGQYSLAVIVVGWFDILTNFGLNTLVTREVAKERTDANRYLYNTMALRLGLWLASIPLLAAFFLMRGAVKPMSGATVLAISLFAVGLLPSNMSASFAAVFNAYERMEVPAWVSTVTTLFKVALGTIVLLAGLSYVGLAGVSIAVNLITLAIFYVLLRRSLFRPHFEVDWAFQRRMFSVSYPLMLNLLLATLFFKMSMLLLEWMVPDDRVLGWYGAAYKYVDAVQVIPAYFTMALFPIMSRFAVGERNSLLRAYLLAIKLLLLVAIPVAFVGWGVSRELIAILGGTEYLPEGADILKVMIWYMPVGFINSVTQYVLIALDQQRFLTRAFAIGLAFNVAANVLLIRQFGYMAPAYVTIASEVVLLIPFYVGIRRHLAPVPWARLLWRPLLAAAPMGALLVLRPGGSLLAALLVGFALYLVGVVALRVLAPDERDALAGVIPWRRWVQRMRGWLPVRQ